MNPRGDTANVAAKFRQVAAEDPSQIAVTDGGHRLSRSELAQAATAMASELGAAGVRPGHLVAVALERSPALVAASAAVIEAGAAYVAIDPAYPLERISYMLEDSASAALVADGEFVRHFPFLPTIAVDRSGAVTGRVADGERKWEPGLSPEGTAYSVYTSGSTGTPKGVLVAHSGLANLVAWHCEAFGLGPDDRCSMIASPGFDASIWEVWPALAAGASLHVVPAELRTDPAGLRDWLVEERITVCFVPTAAAEMLLRLAWPDRTPLRHMLTGGDQLTVRPPKGLPFALVNNYGLSETTVVATSAAVPPTGALPPPIGRPIAGVLARVVDGDMAPVTSGQAGELIIGGAALAIGYAGATPDGRFVNVAGERWFRTGDMVREQPDGQFDFVGRADDQLSLRGFRIEPAEVTAVLNRHPAVSGSVAVGVGDTGATRRLVAYLVAHGEDRPSPAELDAHVARSLPHQMVPSGYVWLDELPLTANGKIDRHALVSRAVEPAGEPRSEAGDSVEEIVATLVAELVGVDGVGPDDNFFLLGGHSLLGAQLIARLEVLFGVELSLKSLFDHPTVRSIAESVERERSVLDTPVAGG